MKFLSTSGLSISTTAPSNRDYSFVSREKHYAKKVDFSRKPFIKKERPRSVSSRLSKFTEGDVVGSRWNEEEFDLEYIWDSDPDEPKVELKNVEKTSLPTLMQKEKKVDYSSTTWSRNSVANKNQNARKEKDISLLQPLSARPDFSPELKKIEKLENSENEGRNIRQEKIRFRTVKEPMKVSRREFVDLLQKGHFSKAKLIYKEVRKEGNSILELMDEKTFGLLIKTALQEEEVLEAATILEDMVHIGLKPRVATWSAVVSRLGRSGTTALKALSIFDKMCGKSTRAKHMRPDSVAFNAALNSAVTAGMLPVAEALLHRAMPAMGVVPTAVSFNILFKGMAMEGSLPHMRLLLHQMKEKGVRPDVSTYNTLISALVSAGDLEAAEVLLGEMGVQKGEKRGISPPKPQVRTLSILVKGYVDQGKVEKALEVMRSMEKRYGCRPNEVTYTSVLSGYISGGHLEAAEAILQEMTAEGIPPSVVTYNAILKGFCRSGLMGRAAGLFQEMVQRGIPPDSVTYNTIIGGYVQEDDDVAAFDWFLEMRKRGLRPTEVTFTDLVGILGRTGRADLAEKIFREMQRDRRIPVDVPAWNAIVHCFSRLGDMERAHSFFSQMKESGLRPSISTYGTLIKGYAKLGRAAEALVLWREIKDRMGESQGGNRGKMGKKWRRVSGAEEPFQVDEALLDDLIYACVRAGYFQRALEVIKEMEQLLACPANSLKIKYKRLFVQMYSEMEVSAKENGSSSEDLGETRGNGLEAFKFWLGLPNSYYQKEWTWRQNRQN